MCIRDRGAGVDEISAGRSACGAAFYSGYCESFCDRSVTGTGGGEIHISCIHGAAGDGVSLLIRALGSCDSGRRRDGDGKGIHLSLIHI